MISWHDIKRFVLNAILGKMRVYVEDHPLDLQEYTVEHMDEEYVLQLAVRYLKRDRLERSVHDKVGYRLLRWSHDKPVPIAPWCFSEAKVMFLAAEHFRLLAIQPADSYVAFSLDDPLIAAMFPDIE